MPHKSFVTFVLPHTTTRAEKWPLLSVSFLTLSQWVKITQKVSFNNLASEASNYLSLELLVFMRLFWWIWTTVLNSQWLKITQKVSFYSFASEASYVDKSLLKMPKMVILASFWKPVACGQTVLPDMSHLIVQKIGGKMKILPIKTWNPTFWVIFKQDLLIWIFKPKILKIIFQAFEFSLQNHFV